MLPFLILLTIIVAVGTFIGVWKYTDEAFTGLVAGFMAIVGMAVITAPFVKVQISSSTLTGYVYQRQERFGYATYDLRFSQNAGTDNQPSFCVKAGTDTDNRLQAIVGDSTAKVTLDIPSHGPYLSNPFACNSEAIIKNIAKQGAVNG